jgi:glycosyltransferase involved in cell wall biosynthesis
VNVFYACQAVDDADPVHASIVRWIRALAAAPRVGHVTVATLRTGSFDLPDDVDVVALGTGRVRRLLRFYRAVLTALRAGRADVFFVMQGGPYPLLLLPVRVLARRPVYQWKAHPHVGLTMRVAARCDDLVFTSTRHAFPLPLANVRVVGQGIDVDAFTPVPGSRAPDRFLALGRVAPVKRLERAIDALAELQDAHGRRAELVVVGPCLPGDAPYRATLDDLAARRGVDVSFRGSVHQSAVPALVAEHRALVNFSTGALDRSSGEAMACGVPVLTSNESVAGIVPDALRDLLVVEPFDARGAAERMDRLARLGPEELDRIGGQLRETIVRGHSLRRLWDLMLDEIDRQGRRPRLLAWRAAPERA